MTIHLKDIIQDQRLHHTEITDNIPPFSSETLAKFLSSQHINYITSSTLYPKSNGFVE